MMYNVKGVIFSVILAVSITSNIFAFEAWYQAEKHLLAWQQTALEQDSLMVLEGQLLRDMDDLMDKCLNQGTTTVTRKPN